MSITNNDLYETLVEIQKEQAKQRTAVELLAMSREHCKESCDKQSKILWAAVSGIVTCGLAIAGGLSYYIFIERPPACKDHSSINPVVAYVSTKESDLDHEPQETP